jgi:hypothetical protein
VSDIGLGSGTAIGRIEDPQTSVDRSRPGLGGVPRVKYACDAC